MRERGFVLGLVCLLALAVGPAFAQPTVIVDVPLDQQINFGHTWNVSQSPNGDAIYSPASLNGTVSFQPAVPPDEPDGFCRVNMGAGWYYGPYIDFNLAEITTLGNGLDLTDPTKLYKLEVDLRYYQDELTNTNPYGDAPIFFRMYTYDVDGDTYLGHRDYSIIYATQGPWNDPPYPDWTHKSIPLNFSELWPYADGGAFDPANISRIRFYGTDWAGGGDDFIDAKNFQITEEIAPATVSGVVTDGSGNPINGAVVGVKTAPNAAADAMRYKVTGADGAYSFLLEAGDYYVAAWMPGYAPSPDTSVTLAGADITGVNLQVTTLAADNIAPGSAVSATSDDPAGGFGAESGIDDNLGTRWTTMNPLPDTAQDQSYTIDLGSVKDLTGITILWENAYPGDYEVLTTNDDPGGTPTWTTIYSATDSTGGWQMPGSSLHFEPIGLPSGTQARGIQFHVTKFGPYPVYSAWEFYIHGTTTTQTPVTQMTIQAAKQLSDGATVQLIKPVSVSGMWNGGESTVFRNKFWMEEADRSSGIRIDMVDHWCWPGELDYVKGTMATDPVTGERYILGESTNWFGLSGVDMRPFAMCNRALTDTKLPFGLLVKTWGMVTEVLTDGSGYKLTDGSGIPFLTVLHEGVQPAVGAFRTVVGALSGEPTLYTLPADGFIRTWLFHGGYSTVDPNPSEIIENKWETWQQSNLNEDFLATAGGEANIQPLPGDTGPNGAQWFVYTTADWMVDLTTLPFEPSGEGMTTVYASVWLLADREYLSMDPWTSDPGDGLEFLIGTDDGYKLYLNGVAIAENNIWRGIVQDEDVITYNDLAFEQIVLNAGWNHLLIKVNNITGGWGMGLRLMADDPTTGLQGTLELPYSVAP